MTESLEQQIKAVHLKGEAICAALQMQADKLGFTKPVKIQSIDEVAFTLHRDPASGKDSLEGVWRNRNGAKLGNILFHADGSFFAEFDILRPHPSKKRWFVEAVTAWGRDDIIKAEPRLLPALN